MKVKQLFECINLNLSNYPKIVVYDYKTDETHIYYTWLLDEDYMKKVVEKFGEREIMKDSIAFGETSGEETFLHYTME